MEIKDIKILVDLMRKNDLSVFKMEKEGFKITLKRGAELPIVTTVAPSATPSPAPLPAGPLSAGPAAVAPESSANLKEIVSPMVGTFYASASPEAEPYVRPGQQVTPDTVVCIVEAMKVMNEIKAEISGTIAEVCVESGTPVQYGQALFQVK